MASKQIFQRSEDILQELLRQQNEDSESDAEYERTLDDISESEDEVLVNSDIEEDVADSDVVGADSGGNHDLQSDTEGMVDDRDFELGKDGLSVWTDKPLHSKFSRTCSSNVVIHLPGPKADAKGVKCYFHFT